MSITLRKITDPHPSTLTPQPLTVGDRVDHVGYGPGVVTRGEMGGTVMVEFDRARNLPTTCPSWSVTRGPKEPCTWCATPTHRWDMRTPDCGC